MALVFAWKLDFLQGLHVDFLLLLLLLRPLLRLLGARHLLARQLAPLEEGPCVAVDVGAGAGAGAGLPHEVGVGGRADVDGALEVAHFHVGVVEEGADLAPDLVAVLVDGLAHERGVEGSDLHLGVVDG